MYNFGYSLRNVNNISVIVNETEYTYSSKKSYWFINNIDFTFIYLFSRMYSQLFIKNIEKNSITLYYGSMNITHWNIILGFYRFIIE